MGNGSIWEIHRAAHLPYVDCRLDWIKLHVSANAVLFMKCSTRRFLTLSSPNCIMHSGPICWSNEAHMGVGSSVSFTVFTSPLRGLTSYHTEMAEDLATNQAGILRPFTSEDQQNQNHLCRKQVNCAVPLNACLPLLSWLHAVLRITYTRNSPFGIMSLADMLGRV